MKTPKTRQSFFTLIALVLLLSAIPADSSDTAQQPSNPLKELTLEQLGNVEVTTVSKEPEQLWKAAAAVFVLTSDDIRRSGATSIPELLRLVPGVEVARIDSDQWAIGIRGTETNFSKGVLVLIDGRSVYTPLYAGVYWDVQDVLVRSLAGHGEPLSGQKDPCYRRQQFSP
jgi:iron complex outermembrane recepter protein